MKKPFLAMIMALLTVGVFAQVMDGFEDMEFLHNPLWVGDTGQFKVTSLHMLQLKSTGSDTSSLSTRNSQVENTEWHFWIKLSFNTSANNYARIYLVSDQEDLKKPLNGYFLQVGGSNDSLNFFKQSGIVEEKLFQGAHSTTSHSTNVLYVKVIHDTAGTWHLYSDTTGGTNCIEEGHYSEHRILNTGWFGVYCRYTTSNSTKFYFDNFYVGPIQVDTIPPEVTFLTIADANKLTISFSENVQKACAENVAHYSTMHSGSPHSALLDPADPRKLTLTFPENFPEGVTDTLVISDIIDLGGNHSYGLKLIFCPYHEKTFDILITEIMADPDPPVGLPPNEYVELYNRTQFPIPLKSWTFEYGTHSKVFPEVTINPYSYLLLTQGVSLNGFGQCVDILSSGSVLSNEESTLVLKNKNGKTIHQVSYSKSWYESSLKENGGWSLEMIDPKNPCGCRANWRASESFSGGTPGHLNSVNANNPDNDIPYLRRAIINLENRLELFFNEPMDSATLSGTSKWTINPSASHPDSLTFVPPVFDELFLWFSDSFKNGIQYSLTCSHGPTDCAKHGIDTLKTVHFAIPDSVEPGDIIINEILSNPASGGERFIEIYNRSQKVVDLSCLSLASMDTISGDPKKEVPFSSENYLCFPGDYHVLTVDPGDIQSRYYSPEPDAFLVLESIPAYQEDHDVVAIIRKFDGRIIDIVRYTKEMYSPLLANTDGVSLERINPFLSSGETGNWHSASENCGFATPGYKNSEYMDRASGEDWMTLIPAVFSPDNDGIDDFLTLNLHPDKPGYSVTITVFDNSGRTVRQLSTNRLLSAEDQVIWDGTDENRHIVTVGIYVLFAEFIDPKGTKKQVKKAVVVAGRF